MDPTPESLGLEMEPERAPASAPADKEPSPESLGLEMHDDPSPESLGLEMHNSSPSLLSQAAGFAMDPLIDPKKSGAILENGDERGIIGKTLDLTKENVSEAAHALGSAWDWTKEKAHQLENVTRETIGDDAVDLTKQALH